MLTGRTVVRLMFVLAAAAVWTSLVALCGGRASDDAQIDVAGLEQQLARMIHLQKLEQGFDFDVAVACLPGGDELHFSCRVDATRPNKPVNAWNVLVSCEPPGRGGHRCSSDYGDALQ
jgi:hypothetical protein